MNRVVDVINKFFLSFRKVVWDNKIVGLMMIFLLVLGLVILLPVSFAQLVPVRRVEIKSEKLNFDGKDTGAWKVIKSAKWTGLGEAEVTFSVDSKLRNRSKNTDIVLVLDISSSMEGRKIERFQKDSIYLLNDLLADSENKAALITFSDSSRLISDFTNDKDTLISSINNITLGENTNYYNALGNVDKVLKNYHKEEDRECIVLFLTDGWPNRGIPNEVGQYNYLKRQYPYAIINGIQYEMGDTILEQLRRVTDNQFVAYVSTLSNVLTDASVVSKTYKEFSINDFIDTRYFYVEKASDVDVSSGRINFDKDNQKVNWEINDYNSGQSATMKIKIKLKEELIGVGGIYPTNEREEIKSKIGEDIENVISEDTPILADNYKVIYDGNAPDECTVSNVPLAKNRSVYDTVEVSDSVPKCDGYYFKRWQIVNRDVKRLNDDYFIMPEEDVTLRAVWKKLKVKKSSEGELAHQQTLYEYMADNSVLDDRASEFVTAETGIDFAQGSSDTNGKGIYEFASTKDDKYPVYYYRGQVENNVKFANICWKIVRTTDTGGVKLLYNGVPDSNGWCNNTEDGSVLTSNRYNNKKSIWTDIAELGYMYGTSYLSYQRYRTKPNSSAVMDTFGEGYVYGNDVEWDGSKYTLKDTFRSSSGWRDERGTILTKYHYACWTSSTTCTTVSYIIGGSSNMAYYIELRSGETIEIAKKKMFSNDNDSEIKKVIDNWYENNMIEYAKYLEDTVWCNDRSLFFGTLVGKDSTGSSFNYFSASCRVEHVLGTKEMPSTFCLNIDDSFTVSQDNGNGKLKYPVALLTADEVNMAGVCGVANCIRQYTFLAINKNFWTMSPMIDGQMYSTNGYGISSLSLSSSTSGVRPSISLVPGARVSEGDGTVYDPFVISFS